jgi:hypothetical protein
MQSKSLFGMQCLKLKFDGAINTKPASYLDITLGSSEDGTGDFTEQFSYLAVSFLSDLSVRDCRGASTK